MLCAPHPQCRLEKVGLTTGGVGGGKSPLDGRKGPCKGSESGTIQGNG